MRDLPPSALANAAETRRRELPATVALVILTGGLAAAIVGGAGPVAWSAIMAAVLIADAAIYRRLDLADASLEGATLGGLAAWSFFTSSAYVVLPAMLWLDGEAAGAAAAMILWVAGVVRHLGRGAANAALAAAGAAPPALSLLLAPMSISLTAMRPDWDVAVIASLGGAALMLYVAQARIGATEAERAMRQATVELSLQHTLAQLLLDQGAVSAFLLDDHGKILAISGRAREGLGLINAEGRSFEDACPWATARWRDAYKRALTGEAVDCDHEQVDTPVGPRWLQWEVRPWRGHDGRIKGALVHGRDITPIVEARRQATSNEEHLRMALEAGQSIAWEVDYKNEEIRWFGDPTPIYGYEITYEEFLTSTTKMLLDEDRPMVSAYIAEVIAGAQPGGLEHRAIMPDGAVRWVQMNAKRVLGRSGGARKVVLLSKDITARKQEEGAFLEAMRHAENRLRATRALTSDAVPAIEDAAADYVQVSVAEMFERLRGLLEEMDARDLALAEMMESLKAAREAAVAANVSKSQFLASMSHELRTPLNAIIGYSEILLEEAQDDGRARDQQDIERVLSSAKQLLQLINGILDLSKIEAGKMDVAIAEFDVAKLISEAQATVRPAVAKNGNTLRVETEGELGTAQNDAFKLNQCLLNLLSNAAKFTKQGEIVVTARRDGEWIEIAIKDSGIGMTEEQVGRLFQSFVQAEATTARKFGGTGLGLAITRRMLMLLGGDIRVESVHGKGSTFTLRFPVRLAAPASAPAMAAIAAPALGRGQIVLVIDDDESTRDLVARSLTRLGFEVRTAVAGEAGLELARQTRPAAIVLDINLPDMSGWDVLEALHAAPETAATPILVHSVDDDVQRAASLGAAAHIRKPSDRDVLAAAVARLVRPSATTSDENAEPAGKPASPLARTA